MADLGAVRRRRQRDAISAARETARDGAAVAGEEVEGERDAARCAALRPGTYWLTRIFFIRSLGFVYFTAFLVALNQNRQLVGSTGLTPIPVFLSRVRAHFRVQANTSTNLDAFSAVPTLLWWVADENIDSALSVVAAAGLAVSACLVVRGAGNAAMFATLWVLYHSLVNVGQRWYSFGWESQLLETGFLAIFLSPLLSLSPLPRHTPSSWAVVWGYRWLLFRIMLGAGLIKIRGDQCWRDLTCLNYHYETQPVPNPLSYYLHQSPVLVHKAETLGNHGVELIAPFFLFMPRPLRMACGALQIIFQVVIIVGGNLSFLNWLTILPAIMCFDDRALASLFPRSTRDEVLAIQEEEERGDIRRPLGHYVRRVSSLGLAVLLAYLSVPVVQNLLSRSQAMNTSFDTLRIVNTYGAFGSVTKERTEVVFEGTLNTTLGDKGALADWREIEFYCKPGRVDRRPCLISPYHYRLDWLMWFAAFQTYEHNPWLVHFAGKLLAGDPSINDLVEDNPFRGSPPKYVRALHYRYRYTRIGSPEARLGHWWSRRLIGEYLPIVSSSSLRSFVELQGWAWYQG